MMHNCLVKEEFAFLSPTHLIKASYMHFHFNGRNWYKSVYDKKDQEKAGEWKSAKGIFF